jgi:hypothetical protein
MDGGGGLGGTDEQAGEALVVVAQDELSEGVVEGEQSVGLGLLLPGRLPRLVVFHQESRRAEQLAVKGGGGGGGSGEARTRGARRVSAAGEGRGGGGDRGGLLVYLGCSLLLVGPCSFLWGLGRLGSLIRMIGG